MKIFVEEQRFNQWWMYFIFLASIIGSGIGIYHELKGFPEKEESIWALSIATVAVALSMLLIFSIRLRTKIDEQGVHYQFVPFHSEYKLLPWKDIEKCYVRTYNPILEYGGWGYRTGLLSSRGRAFNIRGNKGIQVEMKQGKKILFGTQKMETAQSVIHRYLGNASKY